jgi:twitching motility protein PilT
MSLIPLLLRAIATIDGEALVLHVGDRPYMLCASGQIELTPRAIGYDEVMRVITQLLPDAAQRSLQEVGAAQHELIGVPEFPGQQFNIVAARGGNDVWIEIRRKAAVARQPGVQGDGAAAAAPDWLLDDPPGGTPESPTETADAAPDRATNRDPGDSSRRIRRIIEPSFDIARDHVESGAELRESNPPAIVVPLTRTPLRADTPPPLADQAMAGLDRLLRLAAARGASTLFLSSGARPSIRVDGEVQALENTTILGPNEVESLLLTLMPERNAEALRTGATSDWICDFSDLGRVRCMSFRDHRGPGGVFRIMPTRAVTSQQLGLSQEIQMLVAETEGLVLVTGPRSSGKRTLMSALIDLINRTRRAHIITIEREINIVHERASSFVSQREAHGPREILELARAALREDPDVLLLESVRGAELTALAFDAAASGRLVICGLPAHSATGAIDAIIDMFPPDARRQVQISLAQNLRGVIVQVLLNKTTGGRLAARELLLNTPAVANVIAEGKTSQLPLVIDGGRKHGMVPLNDALAGFVQSGAVDLREAFQHSPDRPGFLATLQRQGIDTSSIERFA